MLLVPVGIAELFHPHPHFKMWTCAGFVSSFSRRFDGRGALRMNERPLRTSEKGGRTDAKHNKKNEA